MYHTNSNYFQTHDRYLFQGSEMDVEVKGNGNSYTTMFRQLDPRLGRWLSLDPVFQPHQSPYNSMDNNPIMLNDIFGLKGEGWGGKKKEDGGTKWEYDDDITPENYKDKGFTTYMDEGVIYGENLATEVKSNYELLKNGEYLDLNLYNQNEVIIFPKSNEENQNSPTNNNSIQIPEFNDEYDFTVDLFTTIFDLASQNNPEVLLINTFASKFSAFYCVSDQVIHATNDYLNDDYESGNNHLITAFGYTLSTIMMASPTGVSQVAGAALFITVSIYDYFTNE